MIHKKGKGMTGKHHTEETKKKMSLAKIGNKIMLGKHLSEEAKRKISQSLKGIKRKPFTEEHKRKISKANKGKIRTEEVRKNMSGKNSSVWKGNKAKKVALHKWLRKHKSKLKFCENCKKEKKLILANIRNHQYTRNPDDYKWWCYSCHSKLDFPDGLIGKNFRRKK